MSHETKPSTLAQRERRLLVETLRAAGPDAPTLCEGWATRDLAAHLVLRERRIDAMPGIQIKAFAGHTATVQTRIAGEDWDDVLHRIASGPPWWSPLRPVDRFANGTEMFIHHEDVRRAAPGWQPRPVRDEDAGTLRAAVRMMGRSVARAGARVTFADLAGATVATVGRGPDVTVSGALGELVMYASGRDEARVDLTGDAAGVAAVHAARG